MSHSQSSNDMDVHESCRHSCQCATTNNDRQKDKPIATVRQSMNSDLLHNNTFEPIGRLEEDQLNNHQGDELLGLEEPLNHHRVTRNLCYGSQRRSRDSPLSLDHEDRRTLTPSPCSLLESDIALLENSPKPLDLTSDVDLDRFSPKQTVKDKSKNIQQVLSPGSPTERNVHPHTHRHKHNLDDTNLMSYQRQQHGHHHHPGNGNNKMSNVVHHHGHHSHATQNLTNNHRHGNPLASNGTNVHHHHHHHRRHLNGGNSTFTDHHPTVVGLSGNSSNSSMLNHGGSSPPVHRHAINTPLIGYRHGSLSGSMSSHPSINHHHVSSGISCESSSSNANTRTHSRLDHVYDHHHHHTYMHPIHPDSRIRDRSSSSMDHHHGHVDNGHIHLQGNDMKNSSIMGMSDGIQLTSSTNKCQCHMVQQNEESKREPESDIEGVAEMTSRTHQPPALPPRPPPRPARRYEATSVNQCHTGEGGCCKKYVILCCLCGGLSAVVGILFLAVHAILSAHTASLALFETVPSYIPGIMLILMGLFTMLLARRKHRYGLLMKLCGSVGVVCALVCVLVTVTTTVVHMSRLQGLRQCVYTDIARSCTCYGTPQSKGDPGVLFEGTPHCEVVQGTLYACLRALFGVSVAGILACIFSCMLVYQLLSHEKKKMYWEQLELRCRTFYGQGGNVGPTAASCGCCNDCGGASPWWAQTPGNLYTPNPDLAPSRRWRLPWSRSRGPAPSPDSNYGFHTQARQAENDVDNATGPYSVLGSQSGGPYSVLNPQNASYNVSTASYSVLETPGPMWGPPPPYSDPNSPARRPQMNETRTRGAKRIDNFEPVEDHRPRPIKRPSDNYENAEEISNSTDPENANDAGTMKNRKTRKVLKGVENGAFQQEPNASSKQSESELYFGDVSSCCGPESSFYDLAVEKEGMERSQEIDYSTNRLSKRTRLPLPLSSEPTDVQCDSYAYASNEESRSTRGPFLAPDAQYEVIQQGRYSYYTSKEEEEHQQVPSTSSFYREEDSDNRTAREREYRDYRNNQEEEPAQCCLSDATTLDSGWQSGEQQQSDDNICPVNV